MADDIEIALERARVVEMGLKGFTAEELADELVRRRGLYSIQGRQAYYNEVARVDSRYLEHIDKDIAEMIGRAMLAQDLITFEEQPFGEEGRASKRVGNVFVLKDLRPLAESGPQEEEDES